MTISIALLSLSHPNTNSSRRGEERTPMAVVVVAVVGLIY